MQRPRGYTTMLMCVRQAADIAACHVALARIGWCCKIAACTGFARGDGCRIPFASIN